MQVGVMIEGQEGLTWDRWFRLAEAAEDLGFESLCRSDHLTGLTGQPTRASLETWTSLTALATRTRRIRFGPMVCPVTFYHPAILAKMAHAVDRLAGGRLDLGIGAGWNEYEHAMFGIPFPPLRDRLDRLEAAARVIRALDAGQPVTIDQPHYPLKDAQTHPGPTGGRLRVVVGGRGEKRTLRIVARYAHEWNVTRVDVVGFRSRLAALAEHCAVLSRDLHEIRRSLMVPCALGQDRAAVTRRVDAARAVFPVLPEDEKGWRAAGFLVGSPEQVAADLAEWSNAGLDRVLLQTMDQDDIAGLTLFAREVMDRLPRRPSSRAGGKLPEA
jgi:alkanesulfonate monooxygenase SsuD/methylene tetrahydromethanopterin reductase-like flavin-dependent oxidoreductase (luciferase family)